MDLCDVTSLAASMGVTKVDGSALDPRPSIVLGAQESTPLAMANAYATFAGARRLLQAHRHRLHHR